MFSIYNVIHVTHRHLLISFCDSMKMLNYVLLIICQWNSLSVGQLFPAQATCMKDIILTSFQYEMNKIAGLSTILSESIVDNIAIAVENIS